MMPVRKRRQVEARKFRMLQFGDEHGRHAIERRALLLLHRRQRDERIEALARKDHGRAVRHRREVAHHHAEAVIERHRDAHPVLLGQRHRAADEVAVVEDVVVRQRHALRRAGGAAGELDVDRIVELQAVRERCERVAMPVAAHRQNVLERDRAGLLPPIWMTMRSFGSFAAFSSPGARARKLRRKRVDHLHVVAGLERGRRDQRRAAHLGERELQFVEAIGRD